MGLLKGKIQYDKSVNQQWNILKSKNYYILLWNIIIITVNIPLFFSIIFLSFSFLLKRKGLNCGVNEEEETKGHDFHRIVAFSLQRPGFINWGHLIMTLTQKSVKQKIVWMERAASLTVGFISISLKNWEGKFQLREVN